MIIWASEILYNPYNKETSMDPRHKNLEHRDHHIARTKNINDKGKI